MEDYSASRAPPRTFRKVLVQCLRLTGIAAIAVLSVGYLLPTAVALHRRRMSKVDRWLLFILNVGAGWTVVGWYAALRIALAGKRRVATVAPRVVMAGRVMTVVRARRIASRRRVNAGCGWVRYRPVREDPEHCARLLAARRSWRIDIAAQPTPPGLSRIERFALMDLEPTDQRWHRRGLRA
ncbi:superinfection immunity protein [Paraburkholderia aspalathi]|nr:superinfection immunity protein [Paraburkholderia aspalathi]MBK3780153.1 superinfection immunity protein [Paraburkholderia aspalathi]